MRVGLTRLRTSLTSSEHFSKDPRDRQGDSGVWHMTRRQECEAARA
ncbi:hypothetical protein STRTUCAR8_01056 [Streptomyces turgidiscabies Car8]|uniref:Uncharacterized protein n=1 Tax=Streptomyces turgidiscabies (strain Car8) TaxID=698760 RepID=L7F4L7_STRT8|nr:hypothetical protein STRTUCAR8_01056 [Streptomyces turgidiscabies Car8]